MTDETIAVPRAPEAAMQDARPAFARYGYGVIAILRAVGQRRPLLLITLIVIVSLYMGITDSSEFATTSNLQAILLGASFPAILTVGMMLLLIAGMFDLSVGSIYALAGIVTAVAIAQHGMSTGAGILVGLVVAACAGWLNGIVVTKFGINALITTLASAGIYVGVAELIGSIGVAPVSDHFALVGESVWLGLQMPVWIALAVIIVCAWAVSQTRYFRQYYYIGANPQTAKLSGIKSERLIVGGFTIMGLLAGLSGVLMAARLNAADPTVGANIPLQVITAAILGGASLYGGEGTILGGVVGVLFVALIQNVLIILNVGTYWQEIVIGGVLLAALALDRLSRRSGARGEGGSGRRWWSRRAYSHARRGEAESAVEGN